MGQSREYALYGPHVCLHDGIYKNNTRLPEIRRSRRTCPANFQNVRRRAVVKFNQMSGERLQMSGEAQKVFGKPDIMSDSFF